MVLSWFRNALRRQAFTSCKRRTRPARRETRLMVQRLEDRWLPAQLNLNALLLAEPVIAGLYSGPVNSFTESGRAGVQSSDFQAVIGEEAEDFADLRRHDRITPPERSR